MPSVGRSAFSGILKARLEPIQTPGSEPIRMLPASTQVDVAADQVRDRGDPQQQRGVEDVGADDAQRRQPEDEDQRDGDQRAGAGRGEAEHEADGDPDQDRGDLVAGVELLDGHALAAAAHEQRAREHRDAGDEQRAGDGGQQEGVERVAAERLLQHVQHLHAAERAGDRADRQPQRDRHVDRAAAPVAPAADASW